tara:strand:- start:543 stop:818 length:276 start_codon:yes stop_codon:yes gene_type:complete
LEKLNLSIKNFLTNNGLEKGVNQQKAITVWSVVVGEKIATNTKPEFVEFGVLTVKTKNSTWRNELQFKKKDIIKNLNKELGQNTIKELRFI